MARDETSLADAGNGGKGGATALVLAAMFRAVPPRLARHSDRSFSPPSPVSPFISSSYSDFPTRLQAGVPGMGADQTWA